MTRDIDPEDVAGLVGALGTDVFWDALLAFLKGGVFFDSHLINVFGDGLLLRTEAVDVSQAEREILEIYYEKGSYILAPYYVQICNKETGFWLQEEAAPEGFRSSLFFQRYYAPIGFSDEGSFIAQSRLGETVKLSLGRYKNARPFGKREVAFLRKMSNLVCALIAQHVSMTETNLGEKAPILKFNILDRLDQFGRDRLTNREVDVLKLVVRGHSVKSCARVLDISPETVRVHRKSIYRKMGVANQGELAAAALDYMVGDQ